MKTKHLFPFVLIAFGLAAPVPSSLAYDYGDYSGTRPDWLDQNLTSGDGNFSVWYTDNTHHSAPYLAGADGDGDTLPNDWEQDFLGGLGATQNGDADGDGFSNGDEYLDGSWPNESFFRPRDTVASDMNSLSDNLIAADIVDTLVFLQGRYADWGFRAPSGLPLTVFLRYTPYGGWGSVNPIWIGSHRYDDLLNDADRRSTAVHELFHNVQVSYPNVPRDTDWFIEGSARMSQDFFFLDQDHKPGSRYCGEIEGFLADPEAESLFNRSYNAVFYWKYLVEQTGYSLLGQPFEGFDAMDRFMRAAEDREGQNAVQSYLNSLPACHYWRQADFSRFFGTWITALYTRQFNAGSLSPPYYYRDEQEDLPDSLLRPVNIINCAFNVGTGTYTPEAIPINGAVLHNDANSATWTQSLDPWRSRYYAFRPNAASRFVVVWADGKTGQRNYYALAASRGRDVTALHFNFGEDLQRAIYNNGLDEVGVVVGALDSRAEYDLMAWALSEFRLNIVYPLRTEQELVRIPDAGETATFLTRVQVFAYKQESPDDDFYVDGLAPDLFQVTVNGANAPVISGHQVGNEYWLTCEAPVLAAGEYDLQVTLITTPDTEIKSLKYVEAPHVNRMIVIDRSGSMGSELMGNNEKMLAAKGGGRLYTDLLVREDMVGLVSFGGDDDGVEDDATLHELLASASDAYKTTVKNAINNNVTDDPSKYEHTAMGQGLKLAYNQLVTRGRAEDDWRMALLTDGLQDIAPFWADAGVSNVIVQSKVKLDAIALGYGAHENLLRSIATETEGDYFFVPVPAGSGAGLLAVGAGVDPIVENQVANIYRLINERDAGYDRIWSDEGVMDKTTREIQFRVYDGMAKLLLSINWPSKEKIKLSLLDPAKNAVAARVVDRSHALFDLPVRPGTWVLSLTTEAAVPYLAVLTGKGDLSSKVFFTQPDHSDHIGAVQKICLMLLKKNAPLRGAPVRATITTPSGAAVIMELLDGGDHGDLHPDDGIYCRDFRLTPWEGTYQVKIVTEGKDETGPYRLEDQGFFLMVRERDLGDRDKDGMPDDWEARYGLAVGKDDADLDLDGDGLTNLREFLNGGNPANADTDHGGTQDGSESDNRLNLLDYADDLIQPPSAFYANRQPTDAVDPTYRPPRSRQNLLYWSLGPNFDSVDLYRSLAPSARFALIARDWDARKRPYPDDGLVNGTIYYYKIAAKTAKGIRTRLSEPIAAIPKEDNLRPWGDVTILGAETVTSLTVQLALSASPGTKQMRLANRGDFVGSSWEVFKPDRAWNIAGKQGANFVFVQFRDAYENESVMECASVSYDADSDADSLGDRWEMRHFNSLRLAAKDDPDRDSMDNLSEFRLGADPSKQDTDGDGMPDGWEFEHGLRLRLTDGYADLDHDGMSNVAEFIAGTDPTNRNEALRIDSIACNLREGTITLSWPSVPGRFYTVWGNSSLTSTSWLPVKGYIDMPGTGSRLIYTNPMDSAPTFLRIEVRK
ncbi:MAG: VWA domain-containing protein [Verrucomicrobiia bacterium]